MSDVSSSLESFRSLPTKKIWIYILGVVFIVVVLSLFHPFGSKAQPRTVSTVGIGKKSFAAVSAKISFVYYTQSATKTEVAARGKDEFSALLTNLQSIGVGSISQGTSQIVPVSTTAFEFRQGGLIEVSELTRIKYILQSLEGMNNVLVVQTNFLPADEGAVSSDLYSEAMRDAQTKAKQIAAFSKGRLGKVLYVTEVSAADSSGTSVTQSNNQSSASEGVVDSSNIELQKNLTVTFELE